MLILEASGLVRPLAHEVPDALLVGTLHRAPLHRLIGAWEGSERAAQLVAACEAAWTTSWARPPVRRCRGPTRSRAARAAALTTMALVG